MFPISSISDRDRPEAVSIASPEVASVSPSRRANPLGWAALNSRAGTSRPPPPRRLAERDRLRHADAGGLMAHVRTIGKIVGAVFAYEQLIQKRGLVGGPAGSIKLRHVGVGQGAKRGADLGHRLFPGNRQITVGG